MYWYISFSGHIRQHIFFLSYHLALTLYSVNMSKRKNDTITWTNELTNELHKPARKKFKRRKVITLSVDSIWAADLLDLRRYAKVNKNYNYLLMIIDTFSKYAWVIPLRNKNAETVANAFGRLFLQKLSPGHLWCDKGSEFYNRKVEDVLKKYQVKLYSTENEEKSCIVERFIETFMRMMYMYFDANRHTEYIKILPHLVEKYNNTKHRSIGCTPLEARNPDNYQKVYDHLYPSPRNKNYKNELQTRKAAFNIGDKVRLSITKNTFDKGYFRRWTEELFIVDKIKLTDPLTYTVKSLNGEKIKGSFYKEQLQKSKQEVFRIEKIIGKPRIRNGIREVKVKWSGYNDEYNEWIPATEVIKSNTQT